MLEAGSDKRWRQELLDSIEAYAKSDPAEMGQIRGLIPASILTFPDIIGETLDEIWDDAPAVQTAEVPATISAPSVDPWTLGWAKRGKYFDDMFRDNSLHPLSRTIDSFS